jgi:hypothetical protein
VLSEAVADAHLAGLRSEGVSYIFAGKLACRVMAAPFASSPCLLVVRREAALRSRGQGHDGAVTLPQEVRGASIVLLQECRRADDLLVTACPRGVYLRRKSAAYPEGAAACYGRA